MLWKTFIVWITLVFFIDPSYSQSDIQEVLRYDDQGQVFILSVGDGGSSTSVHVDGQKQDLMVTDGVATWQFAPTPKGTLVSIDHATTDKLLLFHVSRRKDGSARLLRIPLWYSILPPLVAILLALILKEVSISLFAGIWTGAFIVGGMRLDSFYYFIMSFLQVVEKYVIHALNDAGHLSVIIFSLLIGGMVAIISRNGGMAGVVTSLSRFAKTARSAQFITWLLGVAIFFDDYANTLIVGNTMRSVTDRFSISREKLAYLVDSTAAPVASIAFITTWIGAELGYIDGGIAQIQDFSFDMTPYAIFIASLKYSFYPLLTLAFILLLIYVGKDFGPMMAAEKRARKTGQVSSAMTVSEDEPDMEDLRPVANAPMAWQHAVYPVLSVIFMTIVGLVSTGMESVQQELSELTSDQYAATWNATWQNMHVLQGSEQIGFFRKLGILIGSADSYVALLWASLIGLVCGIVITLYRKIMNVTHTMHTMVTGFKTMMPALIILTLAWALAHTTEELQTATFLSSALENAINPYLLPMLVFVLAALIAFSTGSSWSTMAILYPIVIPTSWAICQLSGLSEGISLEILLNVISIVMGASVLGDHCSPISDTTILSSLASDCNHIDHVRTQLPYALIVGGISLLCAGLSTYLGGGWLISLLLLAISVAIFLMVITRFGRRALD